MADVSGVVPLAMISIMATVAMAVTWATPPPTMLHLESASSLFNYNTLDHHSIRVRDHLRRSLMLQQTITGGGGVIEFPLDGSADPFILGFYLTRVKLGSNPREFSMIVDTGSDVSWVTCASCATCPGTNTHGVERNFFDSSSSSTTRVLHCKDPSCKSTGTSLQCSPRSHQCEYNLQYKDGSTTSGYLVSDSLTFDLVQNQSLITNSSSIIFGCSESRTGYLANPNMPFDGLFGFGQGALSIISQFYTQGLAPKAFSHCLRGHSVGGGTFVLGAILEPNIVYTPLVPSRTHYSLHLENIAVNGHPLPIDRKVFGPKLDRETIIDSGTSLAHIVEAAYDPLINSISAIVSQYGAPIIRDGWQCYLIPARFNNSKVFPTVSFDFAGGTSMVLKPEQYLLYPNFFDQGAPIPCLGFIKVRDGQTILGELVLKDNIVVYDLAHQRLGWAPYNCSMSVNVNTTREKVAAGGQSNKCNLPMKFVVTILILLLLLVF